MVRIQLESAPSGGFLRTLQSWFRARGAQGPSQQLLAEFAYAAGAWSRNSSVRVLVVDDNPSNLGAASALLEQCGISALLAADGAEAVALCSDADFDLVLMDLQMPVVDGLAATSAIRRNETLNARPTAAVLAFSSCASPQSLLDACGFSGVLCKPCTLDQLEECLVRWCPDYQPCALVAEEADWNLPGFEGDVVWHRRVAASD